MLKTKWFFIGMISLLAVQCEVFQEMKPTNSLEGIGTVDRLCELLSGNPEHCEIAVCTHKGDTLPYPTAPAGESND
jgi:hypothetical protein